MLEYTRICLIGPPSSGKTSLLFRQALHWASREGGGGVLFVAPSPLESLPLLPSVSPPNPHVLSRIHFKYPANLAELISLLSTLHIPQHQDHTPYHSIIVDDLHQFVSNQATGRGANMTSELAQACAYITDAANYMTHQKEKRSSETVSPSGIAVSLSTQTRNADTMVEVVRRWISETFTISPHSKSEFTVTKTSSDTKCLHYKLSHPDLQIMPTT